MGLKPMFGMVNVTAAGFKVIGDGVEAHVRDGSERQRS
jgi:hypothetical protein